MDLLLGLGLGDALVHWLSELLQAEVTRMTIAFMLAARLHRRWVKRDMTEQFAKITASIDHVADVMGRKYDEHEVRLRKLEEKNVE